MSDETDAKKKRAEQLRKRIGELTSVPSGSEDASTDASKQRPGESDAEYVHRRMREIDKKPKDV
jgi:hypothetical protein